jgi:hypothetical protein
MVRARFQIRQARWLGRRLNGGRDLRIERCRYGGSLPQKNHLRLLRDEWQACSRSDGDPNWSEWDVSFPGTG